MKKNLFLVKTVFTGMLTAVTFSFTSCSDDDDLMTDSNVTDNSEIATTRGCGSAIDAFKPNVDHSKWMALLNDNRLVADLSLPGTHDACTGEGQWIQLRQHIMSKLDQRPVLVIGDFSTYYSRDNMKSVFIDAINASGRATCGDAWIEKCKGGVYPELEKDTKIKDDGKYKGWTIRGEMPDKILYINPIGGHIVELLSCEYDNSKQTRAYYKDGGDESLGDHFPLFAKFRLKN